MKINLVTISTHTHLGGNFNSIDFKTYSLLVWEYSLKK